MKRILDYQKQSLDLISKSMGLPTLDESLEDPQGEATDKATKAEQEKETRCYFCNAKCDGTYTIPIVESPKDIDCPPKAPVCEFCFNNYEFK